MIKKTFYILLLLLAGFISLSIYFAVKLDDEIAIPEDVLVEMPNSASVSLIVSRLNEKDILKPAWLFTPYLKLYTMIYDEKIFAGTYKFSGTNTNLDVIRAVFSGEQRYVVKITYPEGITLERFASITSRQLGVDSAEFVNYCNSKENLEKYGIKAKTAEGYLMPDTYNFFLNASVQKVVETLMDQHQKVWKEVMSDANGTKFSKHEILTLASIVEAETPVGNERPIVSGLYLNRLRIGMKLDADPTVQFALNGKKRLTYRDLKVRNPYNTYVYKGLPPGPINSPGRTAMEAVLKPAKHRYMYFVAKGDGSGEHFFAVNYSQHLTNKARYKRNRR